MKDLNPPYNFNNTTVLEEVKMRPRAKRKVAAVKTSIKEAKASRPNSLRPSRSVGKIKSVRPFFNTEN